jgi:hypothetical protein
MSHEGIVVGCDQAQEWLLPWWWSHYSAHNFYPVLFVDFGMSEKAQQWCKGKGVYAKLKGFESFEQKAISDKKKQDWETLIGSLFNFRAAFFKKPFALSQSPFPFSLWSDLDCQIKGSLDPLFFLLNFGVEISIKKNRLLSPTDSHYNSGVIAFRKEAKFLREWVAEVSDKNDQYLTDEHALSQVLAHYSSGLMNLPEAYNWNPLYGPNPEALILHFQGGFLKEEIRKQLYQSEKT